MTAESALTFTLIRPVLSLCSVSLALCLAHQEQARPVVSANARPRIQFRDVARRAGIDFTYHNQATPHKHLIETVPGGVVAFDYNDDGRVDIFFTNGAAIPSLQKEGSQHFNRLFRNDGDMYFTDVTVEAGVAGDGYAMGAAAADYDNDGRVDLLVAGVHGNTLYRNTGRDAFEDISAKAGIRRDAWSVAAAWFDADNDGHLDLFVVNYVQWSLANDRYCGDASRGLRVYCHPKHFEGLPNTLYRNRGDGTFEDVSRQAGIAAHVGKGMSIAVADYDNDGFADVFVANDAVPNFLFHNRGDGTFEETGLEAGVALLDHGRPVSSMGVDFRDYDNDSLPDIVVTALAGETFPLFHNEGHGSFRDATYSSGLGRLSMRLSGWSIGLVDFNNDGWKDLFTTNSHVNDQIEHFESTEYRQVNSVFVNRGGGKFGHATSEALLSAAPRAHRGGAFADFNNDGRIDVVVSALGDQAELWENVTPTQNHWIILKLVGTRSNRDGIGASVRIGDQANVMTTSVGYASSSHAGVHLGLGTTRTVQKIQIRWPSGRVQVLRDVEADQLLEVRESGQ